MARVFFLLPYKELLAPAEALAKDYSGFSELKIVIAETEQGRGIVGVIDGFPPKGVETEADIKGRRALLSDIIGYKR